MNFAKKPILYRLITIHTSNLSVQTKRNVNLFCGHTGEKQEQIESRVKK